MEWQDCKFLAISLTTSALCAIENKTGTIFGQFAYPPSMQPIALALHESREKACLALQAKQQGSLWMLNLKHCQGYRLPVELPAPLQFTITPDFKHAYFVTATAALYHLDTTTLQCKILAQPENAVCVGILTKDQRIYSVWESGGEGSLAVFTSDGSLCSEEKICAIPTDLALKGRDVLIPFTESPQYGEGLAVLTENAPLRYLTVQDLTAPHTPRIYPCSVTLDESKNLAYVVHEDGGSITIVDTQHYAIHKTFSVGRSISNLHLLSDTRFALGTSNMFADLTLLDLINGRLISISSSEEEFSNLLAIL